jgi:hypothetical protein
MKLCSRCDKEQDLKEFIRHNTRCRLCRNELQRIRRRRNKNKVSRVEGIQWKRSVSHYKQEILSKEEFYKWALENPDFHDLFKEWEENKYDRKITPSIDRIDPRFGYFLKNMQFVTAGENSRRNNIFINYGRIV